MARLEISKADYIALTEKPEIGVHNTPCDFPAIPNEVREFSRHQEAELHNFLAVLETEAIEEGRDYLELFLEEYFFKSNVRTEEPSLYYRRPHEYKPEASEVVAKYQRFGRSIRVYIFENREGTRVILQASGPYGAWV